MATPQLEQIKTRMLEILREFADDESITREARLDALDLDSLDIVEMGQIIESETNLSFDVNAMRNLAPDAKPETVGEVIDIAAAAIADRLEETATPAAS